MKDLNNVKLSEYFLNKDSSLESILQICAIWVSTFIELLLEKCFSMYSAPLDTANIQAPIPTV